MRCFSEISRSCTRARLPYIARITILDFTLLAQWAPSSSPVPGDLATLRGYLQYALPLWDRRIVYSCPTLIHRPDYYFGLHSTGTMDSPWHPQFLAIQRLSEGACNMRYLSGIGRSCTCARLPCIARFIILDFTPLAQWTPSTSSVPGDLATLRGHSQYALPLWDRRIVYSCPTSMQFKTSVFPVPLGASNLGYRTAYSPYFPGLWLVCLLVLWEYSIDSAIWKTSEH